MKSTTSIKSRTQQETAFEDLYGDDFSAMQWNPRAILKAMPKQDQKVKKMKSR